MRIIKLKAENIKRLKAVEITPTGDIVQVTGRNGQGKSSLLDAIWWALGGTKAIQDQPIRKGQRKAKVEIDLGKYIVTREFSQHASKLHVAKRMTDSTGTVGRPQEVLDGLLSKVAFDPLQIHAAETGCTGRDAAEPRWVSTPPRSTPSERICPCSAASWAGRSRPRSPKRSRTPARKNPWTRPCASLYDAQQDQGKARLPPSDALTQRTTDAARAALSRSSS